MQDLTTGPISRHLLKTTSFMLVTMTFQTLYFLVDLYWVGRLGKEAVAGVGIEMSGGAPSRVRSVIADRAFLVDLFVELFEVIEAEDSVREQLDDEPDGADFRSDVAKWLELALVARPG